jgi:hypothetical protein
VFLDFAVKEGFDYRVSENWYKYSKDTLVEFEVFSRCYGRKYSLIDFQKVKQVLEYYKGSLTKALLDMFPNIGIDTAQFGICKSYSCL